MMFILPFVSLCWPCQPTRQFFPSQCIQLIKANLLKNPLVTLMSIYFCKSNWCNTPIVKPPHLGASSLFWIFAFIWSRSKSKNKSSSKSFQFKLVSIWLTIFSLWASTIVFNNQPTSSKNDYWKYKVSSMGKNKWLVMVKRTNWDVLRFYNKGQDRVGVSNQLLRGANVVAL